MLAGEILLAGRFVFEDVEDADLGRLSARHTLRPRTVRPREVTTLFDPNKSVCACHKALGAEMSWAIE